MNISSIFINAYDNKALTMWTSLSPYVIFLYLTLSIEVIDTFDEFEHVKRAIINGIVEIEWKMCASCFLTKEGNKCNFLFEYQQTKTDKHGKEEKLSTSSSLFYLLGNDFHK